MRSVLSTCVRLLLLLALGVKGAALAYAAVTVAQPVAAQPVTIAAAAAAQEGHCHDHGTGARDALPSAPASGAVCCEGGICACTCAASVVLSSFFVATPLPILHERAPIRLDYRPSHLLPLPFRPPIA